MPRRARSIQGGYVYHVLNRSNGRQALPKEEDHAAFECILDEAFPWPRRFTGGRVRMSRSRSGCRIIRVEPCNGGVVGHPSPECRWLVFRRKVLGTQV
jgi:hypothetical protein